MKSRITRRDFLKMAGLLPLSVAAPKFVNSLSPLQQAGKSQNVIIVVFDALSAYNTSLYGYQRETTPNLTRLAERAVVYHNHYAGGNFTTPGTASLLTGTQPWTHRAFQISDMVEKMFTEKNIFTAFQNYYRIAYSHNSLVNELEKQFKESLDDLIPRERLLLKRDFIPTFSEKDEDIFTVSWVRNFDKRADGIAYSLFFSYLYELKNKLVNAQYTSISQQYPRGIPGRYIDFLLEDAIDWLRKELGKMPQPFIGYFHFLPPHWPYRTHRDFYGQFKGDGILRELKPIDLFAQAHQFEANRFDAENKKRMVYDEFILYADREFGRLFDYLDSSGLSENTWVILTSDHGEMFERGVAPHGSKVLYEPVIRIPLMIFEPGRKTRLDVRVSTSAIDILPTLLHVTGQPPANWAEGIVLPPYSSGYPSEARSIYILEAQANKKNSPLITVTVALIKGSYKLMYFLGYEELGGPDSERIELYDIKNDPEELNDLSSSQRETTAELLNEIKQKLAEVDEPYL